ncbi:MAG: M28 family peptidase [Pyrinomonadaceae bacterium]
MGIRLFFLCLLLVHFSGCAEFFRERRSAADIKEIEKQITAVTCTDSRRNEEVKKLFISSGASAGDIHIEKFEGGQNITVVLPGMTSETVILGAHYDKTRSGCGAIDNWTGIVILANLYRDLRQSDNQKTYKFAAFDLEEKGLVGSKAMAGDIPPDQRPKYCAMVNFDSFGFSDTWALESVSDKKLVDLAAAVSKARNASFDVKRFAGATSDSKSFRDVGIPSITLSGLGDNWRKYLHKNEDQVNSVNSRKVFENLKFSVQFAKEIDRRDCSSFR